MTKKTRNIFLIMALVLILVNLLSIVMHRNSDDTPKNLAGVLTASGTTVKINDYPIPSYDFKGSVYIAAEDLQLFGFELLKENDSVKISNSAKKYDYIADYQSSLSHLADNTNVAHPTYKTYLNDNEIQAYATKDYTIIPLRVLGSIGICKQSDSSNAIICTLSSNSDEMLAANLRPDEVSVTPPTVEPVYSYGTSSSGVSVSGGKVIVLDPGHGKSSQNMSDEEKRNSGWIYNSSKGQWGEWRHFKSHTIWEDCEGYGCSGRVTSGGGEWYPIYNGDRDTEPDLNLQNALAAKKYLEQMGYTVRLTRSSNNENPSITQRLKYCYPNQNTSASPDALAFICIHSNAGGGSGTAYISLSGEYDQQGIPADYAEQGNALGKAMNDKIAQTTSLKNSGCLDFQPELIAFCKSPVVCAYLEIGFFDNSSDLNILKTETDAIGKAIAEGINEWVN